MKLAPLIAVHYLPSSLSVLGTRTRVHYTRSVDEAENWALDRLAERYRSGMYVITDRNDNPVGLSAVLP